MKKTLIVVICVLVLTNLPIFDFFLKENYTYSNIDGSFIYSEESGKGQSFKTCLMRYGYFLCQHPEKDKGDNNLYRTFTIKPWRFWEWADFIFQHERFALPYKRTRETK
ncbi:hypothetical protein [Mucilaginibacter pedocola]|uniref:Uncharacterized protein n=1 Tax=Mucilaginibacter pedocola TaxID=1792845 RepID=A0A1S9PCK2_9SPHI|nr:hypothetical protein [Mucilaginibacter pedocola]OOQ58318.1 hypothetical protein BC343_11835 [Mucilaginibacter pedocola]